MDKNPILIAAGMSVLLSACSALPTRDREQDNGEKLSANAIIKEQSDSALTRMEELINSLETSNDIAVNEELVEPEYNPLDEVMVNLIVEGGELQYILKAFADQTKMNLIIHPNLIGNSYRVSVDFRDMVASEVFDHLMKIADIHGVVQGNTLIVNPLEEMHFNLSFMETDVKNTFASGGDVLGGKSGSSGGGSGSSSSGGQSNQIKGDFSMSGTTMASSNPYDELDAMLSALVGKQEDFSPQGSVMNAASIEELGALSRLGSAISSDLPLYSLSRMTGSLYVRAKPSVMHAVKKIVDNYEAILGGQILIDAQIIEVALTDQFQFGVDWSAVRDNVALALSPGQRTISNLTSNFGELSQNQGTRSFTITPPTIGGVTDNLFSAQAMSNELATTITMMQGYGDVSVLSNPTIRSKHGQPAIISVGTSTSYISNTRVVVNGGASSGAITSQEIETAQVFDGLMIGVVPFIDKEGGISLSVHPVQSKVNPSSLALVDAGGSSRVTLPVVNLKSIVTQLKVKSGDVVVLGGLIDQVDDRQESGVPGASSWPYIGNLFKKRANINKVRELVILMKVTRI